MKILRYVCTKLVIVAIAWTFAAAASIFTGVLFGVLPAWRMSRLDPALALREGSRTVTSGRGQHRLSEADDVPLRPARRIISRGHD